MTTTQPTEDEGMGCSYCGEDIVAGQTFHVHLYRAGRFIHSTCLAEHRTSPSVAGKPLPMWSASLVDAAAALELVRGAS